MKIVANGINPVNHEIYFNFRYIGFSPTIEGTTFTLHGNLMLFLFIPKNDPTSTKGVDMHTHSMIRTTNS